MKAPETADFSSINPMMKWTHMYTHNEIDLKRLPITYFGYYRSLLLVHTIEQEHTFAFIVFIL